MKKLMLACLIFLGCSENTSPTDDLATLSQDELSNSSSSLNISSSVELSSSSLNISSSAEFSSSSLNISSSFELFSSSLNISSSAEFSSSSLNISSSFEHSSSSLNIFSSAEFFSSSLNISSSAELSSSSLESSSSSSTTVTGNMIDSRDGKTYKTVVIGDQIWMAENLNYGAYLADLDDADQYQSAAQKFCYDNNTANCDAEGGLYQWHTAMGFDKTCGDGSKMCADQISRGNHQGICPSGWHMPKHAEWEVLENYLGASIVAGEKMKLNNTGHSSWDASTSNDGNSSGFSALPSGSRYFNGGFRNRGGYADFWEAAEGNFSLTDYRYLNHGNSNVYRGYSYKRSGFSVRCIQD